MFVMVIFMIVAMTTGNTSMSMRMSGMHNMSNGSMMQMSESNMGTYSLQSDNNNKVYPVNSPSEYSFSIVDDKGNTLKDFAITHTKPMHVIVVRKDLVYFQHIHPEYNQETGVFTLKDLTFPADGLYRIFADFAPANSKQDAMGMASAITLSEGVAVGKIEKYKPQTIGTGETSKTFDGYQVSLNTHGTPMSGQENMLMFTLMQNGKPVTNLEPYLGALGHSVILREDTLDFIHAHPVEDVNAKQTGNVDFMVDFPEAGKYKVFTQFQINGKVTTTNFVISVSKGEAGQSMESMNMSGMNHMGH